MATYKFHSKKPTQSVPSTMVRMYLQRLADVLQNPPKESPQEGESKIAAAKIIRSRRGVDLIVIGYMGQPAHCVVTDASGKPINDTYLSRYRAQLKDGKYYIYHNAGDDSTIDEMEILHRLPVLDFLTMYVKSIKVMSTCT